MSDWPDDEDVRAWLDAAEHEMAPKLRDSTLSLSIVPDDVGGPKFWVELGASIMYEKPIVLLVVEGRSIPQKLQRVAEEIIVVPADPASEWPSEIGEQIEAVVKRIHGE